MCSFHSLKWKEEGHYGVRENGDESNMSHEVSMILNFSIVALHFINYKIKDS